VTRRDFLKWTMVGVPALMCLKPHEVLADLSWTRDFGQLSFLNQQTDEFLSVQYIGADGLIDPIARERLDHIFRCVYSGEVLAIDAKLLVLLDLIRCRLRLNEHPYILLSGYRSPDFNRMLRRQNHQVGQNSFHTMGMAADIRVERVSPGEIVKVAKSLQAGGIGRYRDYVHVDVGPIRYW
jgi:uncharacterized protein YcbK (DUF882 family)